MKTIILVVASSAAERLNGLINKCTWWLVAAIFIAIIAMVIHRTIRAKHNR